MTENKGNPIIVPEIIKLDEDEVNQDDKLGSLGVIPEDAPVLVPAEEIEESEESLAQTLKDKFTEGKEAAAQLMREGLIRWHIQKVTNCLPRMDHPTKKRLTPAQLKARRKRQKLARRNNRNNKRKSGMKSGKNSQRKGK
jgi:hypothetical protein